MEWPVDGMGIGLDGLAEGLSNLLAMGMLVWVLFMALVVLLCVPATRRRRFWCAASRQAVLVEFDECGVPGLQRSLAVRSCSALCVGGVTCAQQCLDPAFRRVARAGGAA